MGKSWYDSLQFQLTQRFSHGLMFNVNYSYSKNLQFTSAPDVFNRAVGKHPCWRESSAAVAHQLRLPNPAAQEHARTQQPLGFRDRGWMGFIRHSILPDRGLPRPPSERFHQRDQPLAGAWSRIRAVEEKLGWKLHESLVG